MVHVTADMDKCTEFLLDTCADTSDTGNNYVSDVSRQLTAAAGSSVARD